MTDRRKVVLGLGAGSALGIWHTPVINAVLTPAHAQASVCPMIVVGNVNFGPQSGPITCRATFDVLSSDAMTPLTITNITNGALGTDVTIDYGAFGEATDTTGPRVTWEGPASDAPQCSDLMPTDEVVFTVTATCAAAPGMGTFTQDFMLSAILMP